MKNYEKYADKIREYKGSDICDDIVKPYILRSDNCNGISCSACHMLQTIWLFEEYEEPKEPEIDWSKVAVDTPILVRDAEYENWHRRYFAAYKDGVVYVWVSGKTSWSVNNSQEMIPWGFAKLAESEEGGAK